MGGRGDEGGIRHGRLDTDCGNGRRVMTRVFSSPFVRAGGRAAIMGIFRNFLYDSCVYRNVCTCIEGCDWVDVSE